MAISRYRAAVAILAVLNDKNSKRGVELEENPCMGDERNFSVKPEPEGTISQPELTEVLECSDESSRRLLSELERYNVLHHNPDTEKPKEYILTAGPKELMEVIEIIER